MKYSDAQRMEKIYDNAVNLWNYVREHNITFEELPALIEELKKII